MRFWVARSEDVPVREQIVAQVAMGIASGELKAGSRLPSTREMARWFGVHANTVSAAYRQMEREGRLEMRRGSGVYVPCADFGGGSALDRLTASFLDDAVRLGFSAEEVLATLGRSLKARRWNDFLLVEPDVELRGIVLNELRAALTLPVRGRSFEEFGREDSRGSLVLVLPSKACWVGARMEAGGEMAVLQVSAVPPELSRWLPAPTAALVGICSRWPEFLKLARAMLVGAGIDAAAMVIRDARLPGWQDGLEETAAVICDVVAATTLPAEVKAIVFRIVGEGSLLELQRKEMERERAQGAL